MSFCFDRPSVVVPGSTSKKHKSKSRRAIRRAAHSAAFSPAVEQLETRRLLSTAVLSYHNNNQSTGVNSTETLLTPTTVNSTQFQKQYTVPVDGQVYAQPLYDPGVSITTGNQTGIHNVTYVATQHDSLYAIDSNGGSVLWHDSFIFNAGGNPNPLNPAIASGVTTVPSGDTGTTDITPEVGITSTPLIDASSNSLFLTAKTKQTSTASPTTSARSTRSASRTGRSSPRPSSATRSTTTEPTPIAPPTPDPEPTPTSSAPATAGIQARQPSPINPPSTSGKAASTSTPCGSSIAPAFRS